MAVLLAALEAEVLGLQVQVLQVVLGVEDQTVELVVPELPGQDLPEGVHPEMAAMALSFDHNHRQELVVPRGQLFQLQKL